MKLKHLYILLTSLFALSITLPSFITIGTDKHALIVALYDPNNLSTVTQDIYRYNFENGELKGKEKLLSIQGRVNGKDNVRVDVGESTIYKNRWLITGLGNIIDLTNKKVVSSERTQLVKCSGDSIIFYTNDLSKGKFYSIFNTKTEKYEEVKKLNFKAIPGQDVGVDYDLQNRRIWLYPVNKEKILLVPDAGFGEDIVGSKSTPVIPIYWINENEFIFPHYSISKDEASIEKVNVNKTITKIGTIKNIPKSKLNSFFRKDGDGNLEYVCAKGSYVVDIKHNALVEVVFEHEGFGFDVENKTQSYGHMIKYKKQEIGKYHCDLKQVKACQVALALDNKLKIGEEVYPQGIAVWNTFTKKWKSIEADEVAAVIGWIAY